MSLILIPLLVILLASEVDIANDNSASAKYRWKVQEGRYSWYRRDTLEGMNNRREL
ncbi:hypothetical protein BDZ89DRAFT_322559 [Hymenopellis radicata]|nr:hypothetical protein BDZ89DRAFT_322559 [Hymenopellis radicata]